MGKISRTRVTLSIWGADIRPEDVTRVLGCQPTRTAQTGQSILLSNGSTRVVPRGYWKLESDETDQREIDQKIERLLGRLNSDEQVWISLAQDHDIELFCGLFLDNWNEGFALPRELMAELGRRCIRVEVDIYSPVNSWPDSRTATGDEQI